MRTSKTTGENCAMRSRRALKTGAIAAGVLRTDRVTGSLSQSAVPVPASTKTMNKNESTAEKKTLDFESTF